MAKQIKHLIHFLVILTVIYNTNVKAEYYDIQRGDELSHIAETKVLKSGLPLNIEQVMLTIYKFNPAVFIEGDINRLLPGKNIYIPDKVEDFLALSKNEAIQRLNDKNFLRELYAEAKKSAQTYVPSPRNASSTIQSNSNGYAKVLEIIGNHQQDIDLLKTENAYLSNSLKLLERALGRLVVVQGLLTNEVVKVKSKFLKNVSNDTEARTLDNAPAVSNAGEINDTAPVVLPKIQGSSASLENKVAPRIEDYSIISRVSGSELTKNKVTSAQVENNALISKFSNINSTTEATGLIKSFLNGDIKGYLGSIDQSFWLRIAVIVIIIMSLALVTLVLWILDFRNIQSRFSKHE